MISQEENGEILTGFLEKSDSLVLVIYVNQQGQLTPINDFPETSKNKVRVRSTFIFFTASEDALTVILYAASFV